MYASGDVRASRATELLGRTGQPAAELGLDLEERSGAGAAPVLGGGAYVVSRREAALPVEARGLPWEDQASKQDFHAGLNLVSNPAGVPKGEDAQALLQRSGASFAARILTKDGARRFDVYLPGRNLTPWAIQSGAGYLVCVPSARILELPTSP